RTAGGLRRAAVAWQLEEDDAGRPRDEGGYQRRDGAGGPSQSVQEQGGWSDPMSCERVAMHAVAVERRRPALGALREHRSVRETHQQIEREIGDAAQRELTSLREHAARRQPQTLALRGEGEPEAARLRMSFEGLGQRLLTHALGRRAWDAPSPPSPGGGSVRVRRCTGG